MEAFLVLYGWIDSLKDLIDTDSFRVIDFEHSFEERYKMLADLRLLMHFMEKGCVGLLDFLKLMIAAFHFIDTIVGEQVGQLVDVLKFVFGVKKGFA